jgi:hypothetical protein
MTDLHTLLIAYLGLFLFPLWLTAGVADYLCHRRTEIERTSGFHESLLHALQALQLAIALLAGLFLEITALVAAVMILAVLAHSATAYWDLAWTTGRRHISPFEQFVHSFLEWIPIVAVSIAVMLHWDQVAAGSFELRWKQEPLPGRYVAVILAAVLTILLPPLLEELWRTWRQRSARRLSAGSLTG